MVVGGREEEKWTRHEETTRTPPKLHSLTVSASCPTSNTRHKPQGNRLAPRHPHYLIESAASHQVIQVTGTVRISVGRRMIRCSTGCTRIPTRAENRRTGAEETEWSGRQRQRESEEFHSKTRSEQKHQECTKRSPTLEAVRVPRSGGGAGTLGACRTRTEARAALGSTGTAT